MAIATIMAGIKALSPTFDSDVDVNVLGYDEAKSILNESECPIRMIGMPDEKNRAQLDFLAMGKASNKMTWEILDRLYMFPVNLDLGVENYAHLIFDYKESYAAQVNNNRKLSTTNAKVETVAFDGPYVRGFPDVPGATAFWVVDAVLTVEEFV